MAAFKPFHVAAICIVTFILALLNIIEGAVGDDVACAADVHGVPVLAWLLTSHGVLSLVLVVILVLVIVARINGGDGDDECVRVLERIAGALYLILLCMWCAAAVSYGVTVAGVCDARSPWLEYGAIAVGSQAALGAYAWYTLPTLWWCPPPPLACCTSVGTSAAAGPLQVTVSAH